MKEVFFSLRGLICGWKQTMKTKISCSFFLWWRCLWAAVVCLSCMFRILIFSFCNGKLRGFDAHYMLCFFCFFSWCHNERPTRFHERERCRSGGKHVCHNATLVLFKFSCYYRCKNDVFPGFGDQISVFFSSNTPNRHTGSNFRNFGFAPTLREAAATAEEREASPARNKETDASKIRHETGDKQLNVEEKMIETWLKWTLTYFNVKVN